MLFVLEVSMVGVLSVIVAFSGHTHLLYITNCNFITTTPDRRQSKTLIPSTNIDQKSLETEFLIVICRRTGDKRQSKTLFLPIFEPRSSIIKSVFIAAYPV